MTVSPEPPSIRLTRPPHPCHSDPSTLSHSMTLPIPAAPMSIPSRDNNSDPSPTAPPPLPPPRNVEELGIVHEPTSGWTWTSNNPNWQGFTSVKPGDGDPNTTGQNPRPEQEGVAGHTEIDSIRKSSSLSTAIPTHRAVEAAKVALSTCEDDREASGHSSSYRCVSLIFFRLCLRRRLPQLCPSAFAPTSTNSSYLDTCKAKCKDSFPTAANQRGMTMCPSHHHRSSRR